MQRAGPGSCVRLRGRVRGLGPNPFEIVEPAHLRSKDMRDDVVGVDQDPVAGRSAFKAHAIKSAFLQSANDLVGHRADMALRPAGRNDHVVGDVGLAGERNSHDVFAFIVVQLGEYDFENFFRPFFVVQEADTGRIFASLGPPPRSKRRVRTLDQAQRGFVARRSARFMYQRRPPMSARAFPAGRN